MDSSKFQLQLFALSLLFYWCYANAVTIITSEDMMRFRADKQVTIIDEFSDLNTTTKEALDILNRIEAIEKKGEVMLAAIPDNGVVCATQVRHRIEKMLIEEMKEFVNNCVAIYPSEEASLELNANQINCINEVLGSTDRDMEAVKPMIEECKLFI